MNSSELPENAGRYVVDHEINDFGGREWWVRLDGDDVCLCTNADDAASIRKALQLRDDAFGGDSSLPDVVTMDQFDWGGKPRWRVRVDGQSFYEADTEAEANHVRSRMQIAYEHGVFAGMARSQGERGRDT
jgi:hypothetical protein